MAGRGTENVVAILPGRGSLAGQDIVIGAHFDHLGNGPPTPWPPAIRRT